MNQPTSHARHRSLRPALVSILLALILFGSLQNPSTPKLRGSPAAELTPLAYLPVVKRAGPTATPTSPSTATSTATATATPSATATPTETPTETQHACLVIYPIGLNTSLFNANGFAPPTDPAELPYYGIYNDATYTNKTQRRVYRASSFATPGFHVLSWLPSNSSSLVSFAAAITGTGTLAQGFDEVTPWPDPNSAPPGGYPLLPGQLNPADWISGFSGNISSNGVRAALQYHADHKTVMSLPIVDRAVGNGQNISFHHARLGDFLLRGFSLSAPPYFDLVYIGASDSQIPLCS